MHIGSSHEGDLDRFGAFLSSAEFLMIQEINKRQFLALFLFVAFVKLFSDSTQMCFLSGLCLV